MTILIAIAGAALVGAGLAAHSLGPDFEPDENDLDLD